jgi:hypothetical protein
MRFQRKESTLAIPDSDKFDSTMSLSLSRKAQSYSIYFMNGVNL